MDTEEIEVRILVFGSTVIVFDLIDLNRPTNTFIFHAPILWPVSRLYDLNMRHLLSIAFVM